MMKTKSFVDGFQSRKISAETLVALLQVDYQREILFDLVFREDLGSEVEIKQLDDEIVIAETKEYMIYLILSTHETTLKKVSACSTPSCKEKKVLTFRRGEGKVTSNEIYFVNPLDWMNAIISNGINRNILHLQFMRDLEFYRESGS